MRIVLHNDTHNTKSGVYVDHGGWLSWRQVLKVRRALCSKPGCSCGNNLLHGGDGVDLITGVVDSEPLTLRIEVKDGNFQLIAQTD